MQMEIDATNRHHGAEEDLADVTAGQQVPEVTGGDPAVQECSTSRYDTDTNPHETGARKKLAPTSTGEGRQRPEESESSSSDMGSWCLDRNWEDDINETAASEEFGLLASSSDEEERSSGQDGGEG